MIPSTFNLIPLYVSTEDYKYKIVLDKQNNNYIQFNVEPYADLYETIKHNIQLYIKSESGIYKIKLTDVSVSDNIDIYFIVFLPYDSIITDISITKEILDIYDTLPQNSQQIISLL